jgi:hypothetical protein
VRAGTTNRLSMVNTEKPGIAPSLLQFPWNARHTYHGGFYFGR